MTAARRHIAIRPGSAIATCAAALAAIVVLAGHARAGEPPAGFLAEALSRARRQIAVARRQAPEPVRVSWRRRRLGAITLSGPLLDLAATDLDGDGEAEILALSPDEVVVLGRGEAAPLRVITRATLESAAIPPIRPRDPVGTLAVMGGPGGVEVWARSSERAEAVALAWEGGKLAPVGVVAGFPICRGAALELEDGKNTFVRAALPWPELPERFHAARCRRDLVDPAGRLLAVRGWVDTAGELGASVEAVCAADEGCPSPAVVRVSGRGAALAVADLDRDGHPEVAATARRAPGEEDEVAVWSVRGGGLVPVFDAEFSGGVGGLAAGDIDGDGGAELLAAVRVIGSRRIELWTLT